jgi:hypothetical protein
LRRRLGSSSTARTAAEAVGVVRYQMPAMLDCPASPIGGYGAVSKRVFQWL